MSSLTGEKRGVFHTLMIRVIENGQARLVNILDLLPSQIDYLFDTPPSTTKTASQYGIAQWVLSQNFLTNQSYVPFNRVGSVTHTLIQELALYRTLANSLFIGLTCQGNAECDTVSINYPAGSSTKQDVATLLGQLSSQQRGTVMMFNEHSHVYQPKVTKVKRNSYMQFFPEEVVRYEPKINRTVRASYQHIYTTNEVIFNSRREGSQLPSQPVNGGYLVSAGGTISWAQEPAYALAATSRGCSLQRDGNLLSEANILPVLETGKVLSNDGSALSWIAAGGSGQKGAKGDTGTGAGQKGDKGDTGNPTLTHLNGVITVSGVSVDLNGWFWSRGGIYSWTTNITNPLDVRITSLETRVSDLENEKVVLQNRCTALETRCSTLEARMNEIETFAGKSSTISGTQFAPFSSMSTLETWLYATFAQTGDIPTVRLNAGTAQQLSSIDLLYVPSISTSYSIVAYT